MSVVHLKDGVGILNMGECWDHKRSQLASPVESPAVVFLRKNENQRYSKYGLKCGTSYLASKTSIELIAS